MSLYKDASLVMIPSAYKDGRLYSIRPVEELGDEEVTNGTFDTDSDWNKSSGVTISGGQANFVVTSGGYQYISQSITYTTGKEYILTADIVGTAGKGCTFYDASGNNGGLKSTNGQVQFDGTSQRVQKRFVANSNSVTILVARNGGGDYTFSVDNVSVKEVITNGDFTFSRGSNLAATRVDVNGLIEKGRENVLLQSNQFDTTWTATNITATSGQTGYDGTTDAWLLEKSAASRYIQQSVSTSGVVTMSVYAKAGTATHLRLLAVVSGSNPSVYFDLSSGAVNTEANNIDASIESAGGGFYRCSMTFNDSSITAVNIYPADGDGDISGTNTNIIIQDAQIEAGLVATDYIETGASTAQAGILEDMPRLDYSGGASCPALLLEPQRLNKISHSEYFGDSSWNNSNQVTRSISDTSSPEGKLNAYDIVPTTSNTNHTLRAPNLSGFTSGAVVNVSFFAKANGYKFISVVGGFGSSSTPAVVFNLDEGTITSGTGTIEDYGSGWYRCITPITLTATALYCVATILDDNESGSFAGDGTSGIIVYGYQIEEASYPTSYIPTMGASVTRSAEDYVDAINFESGDILGSSSPYTLFFDLSAEPTLSPADGNSQFLRLFRGQNLSTTIWSLRKYYQDADGKIRFYSNLDAATGAYVTSTNKKFAMVVDGTDVRFFSDGAKQYTYGATNNHNGVGSMRLSSGYSQRTSANFSQVVIFPTALTDSECIALTS